MDNLINENPAPADAAEAEREEQAVAELGKFKSVKALADAYANLEAEFTRRSQRLKELEAEREKLPAQAENGGPSAAKENISGDELLQAALSNEEVKSAVIGDYLKTVMQKKSVPLMTGGVQIAAERQVPKSVKEAGMLAAQFFKKQEK